MKQLEQANRGVPKHNRTAEECTAPRVWPKPKQETSAEPNKSYTIAKQDKANYLEGTTGKKNARGNVPNISQSLLFYRLLNSCPSAHVGPQILATT